MRTQSVLNTGVYRIPLSLLLFLAALPSLRAALLVDTDFGGAVTAVGDVTGDYDALGTADGGWVAVSSSQRTWSVSGGVMSLTDGTDGSGAGGFFQFITDSKNTTGSGNLFFDIDYERDAGRDADLDVYVVGWNTGDAEPTVDMGNGDVNAGDTIALGGATALITHTGVEAESRLRILDGGVAVNGFTVTENDGLFDQIVVDVDFGVSGYDFIGVQFYGEAHTDSAGTYTETIKIDDVDFANIIWQGGGTDWDVNAHWSNWDGTDANLDNGDILLFNDTGSSHTTTNVELAYTTQIGRILFAESTAYTLNTGTSGSLIFEDAGMLRNNSDKQQTINAPIAARGSAFTIDAGHAAGGSFVLGTTGTIDLSDTSGVTLNVMGDNNTSINGAISGTGGALVKTESGTLTLGGTAANTFTGMTTVSAGKLVLDKDTAGTNAIAGAITVNAGGELELAENNQIADTSDLTLNGGTFDVAGFNETLDNLTLTADSVIDFGSGGSVLNFTGTLSLSTYELSIYNWAGATMSGGGADQLIFSGDTLTSAELNQIRFYKDNGVTPWFGSTLWRNEQIGGEIVPTPEPSTWFTMAGLGLLAALQTRSRLKRQRTLSLSAVVD